MHQNKLTPNDVSGWREIDPFTGEVTLRFPRRKITSEEELAETIFPATEFELVPAEAQHPSCSEYLKSFALVWFVLASKQNYPRAAH
jgi:hypothetical protein